MMDDAGPPNPEATGSWGNPRQVSRRVKLYSLNFSEARLTFTPNSTVPLFQTLSHFSLVLIVQIIEPNQSLALRRDRTDPSHHSPTAVFARSRGVRAAKRKSGQWQTTNTTMQVCCTSERLGGKSAKCKSFEITQNPNV